MLLVTRSNFFNLGITNSSNVFLCSNSVASASAISLFISTRKLLQYAQYFTTLTGILREILAG